MRTRTVEMPRTTRKRYKEKDEKKTKKDENIEQSEDGKKDTQSPPNATIGTHTTGEQLAVTCRFP